MNTEEKDEMLYASEYYCDDCKSYHSVNVWEVGNGFSVVDEDGDEIALYEKLEEAEKYFPEGNPNTTIKPVTYKKVRWYAMINGDFTVGGVTNKSWKDSRSYISIDEAPVAVRLALSLPENPKDGNRMDESIKTWEDLREGLKNIEGEQVKHRNALLSLIKFYAIEPEIKST